MKKSRKTDIRKLSRQDMRKDRNEVISAKELGKTLPSFSLVV